MASKIQQRNRHVVSLQSVLKNGPGLGTGDHVREPAVMDPN